jgi:hypothetical protein
MSNNRECILIRYARWTAFCAVRQGPESIRHKTPFYRLMNTVNFDFINDLDGGRISVTDFDTWHDETITDLILAANKCGLSVLYGWAAKIINVYLKTYVYAGGAGRPGIRKHLHPPMDSFLRKGVQEELNKRSGAETPSLPRHRSIISIDNHDKYKELLESYRGAAAFLGCTPFELEKYWNPSS